MFTGGEAVPIDRAAEFEDRTGALVLQFYGSNETGALSRTTTSTTTASTGCAPRVAIIPEMHVRLFDDDGADVTAPGPGVAACKGPVICLGYYDDPAANAELFTADGWMLIGDIVRRSTPTATSPSSAGRPTSSSAAARTSASPPRSMTRNFAHVVYSEFSRT